MVNFRTQIRDCDSHSSGFFEFISSGASICSTMGFRPLGNSDHILSVSIDFPSFVI